MLPYGPSEPLRVRASQFPPIAEFALFPDKPAQWPAVDTRFCPALSQDEQYCHLSRLSSRTQCTIDLVLP